MNYRKVNAAYIKLGYKIIKNVYIENVNVNCHTYYEIILEI